MVRGFRIFFPLLLTRVSSPFSIDSLISSSEKRGKIQMCEPQNENLGVIIIYEKSNQLIRFGFPKLNFCRILIFFDVIDLAISYHVKKVYNDTNYLNYKEISH